MMVNDDERMSMKMIVDDNFSGQKKKRKGENKKWIKLSEE